MNWGRVGAVLDKEWLELRGNKVIVSTMVVMPLMVTALMVGTAWFLMLLDEAELHGEDALPVPAQLAHLTAQQGLIVMLNDQYMFYLLMLPMLLPMTIATYSIVGEKEARSLEPLLASPLTTGELLVAKTLTGVLPAAWLGWMAYVVTVVGVALVCDPVVVAHLIRPVWVFGVLLLSPLLALFAALAGVIISSRTTDVRAAKSLVGLVVVPFIGLSVVVLMGQVFIDLVWLLWACVGLALVIVGALWMAVRVFNRESILTRWV